MAQTWQDMLDEVLVLTDSVGASDVTNVAKIALIRALRYVARKAELRALVSEAQYTWQSTDTAVSLTGSGGFNVSDYDMPYYMLVGALTETRVPYHFMEFKDWQILKATPTGYRFGIEPGVSDLRFDRAFTLDYTGNILIDPVVDNKAVTLYYFKVPAAFVGSASPEIEDGWRDLITDAAVMVCKYYIENPGRVINMNDILSSLDPQITSYKQHRESTGYRRNFTRIAPSYNHKNRFRFR